MFARAAGFSDVGRKRKHNEDAYLVDDELGLYVVADGMGGHAAGEVASWEAIDQIHGMVRRARDQFALYRAAPEVPDNRLAIRKVLERAVQAATYMVFGMAQMNPEQQGMGTTISILALDRGRAFLAQVGDSRIYQARNHHIVQLTEDHTLVNLQVKMGLLTPEQARTAKHGNVITRAVGLHDYVQVDTFDVEYEPGDRFLLCSDGLTGYAKAAEDLLPDLSRPSLEDAARGLIDFANRGGGHDNITAIVIETL